MSAAPKRKRPGASPISLTPRVEEIRISPSEEPTAVVEPAPITAAPSAPAEQPEPTAPMPGKAESTPDPRTKTTTTTNVAAAPEGVRISRTFKFDEDDIKRAETAVLRTAALPGGYRSMVELVNAALERELSRLERKFNDGEAFPANTGRYRTGRAIGS